MAPSVFDPGLEYITAAETRLSDLDGETGDLVVCGYPVEDLAEAATYEEVLHLLLHDRLPTADELDAFRADLADRRTLGEGVRPALRAAAAADGSAMAALRLGLAAAGLGTDSGTPEEQARRVVAVTPTIVATYGRLLADEAPVEPRADLGHAANYLYMLTGEAPEDAAVRAMDAFLVTLVDHGLNPSTFAARVVASTDSDVVSAATAGVGALAGRRHGGRLDQVFDLLRAAERGEADAAVETWLADEGHVPGFGHRVYEVRDPRAAVLGAAAAELAAARGGGGSLDAARLLEAAGTEALAARDDGPAAPTVEFDAVALLDALDVPRDLLAATFAVSRVGGWVAHALEQRRDERLLRPTARYVGATDRTWTPVEARGSPTDSVLGGQSTADALEPVSETLAVLSDPTRLELLLVLADSDAPVSYSTLQAASSVTDKGRLNYHLRRLRGDLVADDEAGYRLTETGRTVVRALVTDDSLVGGSR